MGVAGVVVGAVIGIGGLVMQGIGMAQSAKATQQSREDADAARARSDALWEKSGEKMREYEKEYALYWEDYNKELPKLQEGRSEALNTLSSTLMAITGGPLLNPDGTPQLDENGAPMFRKGTFQQAMDQALSDFNGALDEANSDYSITTSGLLYGISNRLVDKSIADEVAETGMYKGIPCHVNDDGTISSDDPGLQATFQAARDASAAEIGQYTSNFLSETAAVSDEMKAGFAEAFEHYDSEQARISDELKAGNLQITDQLKATINSTLSNAADASAQFIATYTAKADAANTAHDAMVEGYLDRLSQRTDELSAFQTQALQDINEKFSATNATISAQLNDANNTLAQTLQQANDTFGDLTQANRDKLEEAQLTWLSANPEEATRRGMAAAVESGALTAAAQAKTASNEAFNAARASGASPAQAAMLATTAAAQGANQGMQSGMAAGQQQYNQSAQAGWQGALSSAQLAQQDFNKALDAMIQSGQINLEAAQELAQLQSNQASEEAHLATDSVNNIVNSQLSAEQTQAQLGMQGAEQIRQGALETAGKEADMSLTENDKQRQEALQAAQGVADTESKHRQEEAELAAKSNSERLAEKTAAVNSQSNLDYKAAMERYTTRHDESVRKENAAKGDATKIHDDAMDAAGVLQTSRQDQATQNLGSQTVTNQLVAQGQIDAAKTTAQGKIQNLQQEFNENTAEHREKAENLYNEGQSLAAQAAGQQGLTNTFSSSANDANRDFTNTAEHITGTAGNILDKAIQT